MTREARPILFVDDSTRDTELALAAVIRNEGGEIIRLSGISRDITDRKRADEAEAMRRRQEEHLRSLEETLERYRRLSLAGVTTSTALELAGAAAAKVRAPQVFARLRQTYASCWTTTSSN